MGKSKAIKWCDLNCKNAQFPEAGAVDGSGSCRTFSALYCKKLKRLVMKNAPARHKAVRALTKTPGWRL